MSENYKELLIRNKLRASGIAVRVIFIILIVLLVIGGLFNPLFWILAMAAGLGAYFAFMYTAVEFEYLIIGKEITIDRIYGQQRRKTAETLEMGRLEILAPANSHELDRYRNQPAKKTDYSTGHDSEEGKLYVMYYEGGRKILLNLDEESVKMIKQYAPRKVFDY